MQQIMQEWLDFFEWCEQNGKDPKNDKSLSEYVAELEREEK